MSGLRLSVLLIALTVLFACSNAAQKTNDGKPNPDPAPAGQNNSGEQIPTTFPIETVTSKLVVNPAAFNNSTLYDLKRNKTGAHLAIWLENADVDRLYAKLNDNGQWQETKLIAQSSSKSHPLYFDIAASDDGFAVVWIEDNVEKVTVDIYKDGVWSSSAGTLGRRDNSQTGKRSQPKIISNGTGYGVAWIQNNFAEKIDEVFAAVYDGGLWLSAELVGVHLSNSSIEIQSNGSGYGVQWNGRINWAECGTYDAIHVNVYSAGKWMPVDKDLTAIKPGVSVPPTLAGYRADAIDFDNPIPNCSTSPIVGDNLFRAEFAASAIGYAVVWHQYNEPFHDQLASENPDNSYVLSYMNANVLGAVQTSWGEPVPISNGLGAPQDISLASNGKNFSAIWSQQNTDLPEVPLTIESSEFDPVNRSWSAAQTISDLALGTVSVESIIVAGDKAYGAVWEQSISSNEFDVYGNVFQGNSWQIPNQSGFDTLVSNISLGEITFPAIASNKNGFAISWAQQNIATRDIMVNAYDGNAWAKEVLIVNDTEVLSNVYDPKIVGHGDTFSVIWSQDIVNGTDANIRQLNVKIGLP